jgi:outer membrane protein OmpA-like peptidoglycan-associated protein
MYSVIDYRFNGLKITQKLSPLNSELETCKANDSTRYYQVDYMIENDSNISIKAGILVLFDMMIDNNDAAKMDAFSSDLAMKARPELTNKNTLLRGKYAKYANTDHINRILVYRDTKTTKSLTGDFHLSSEPDEIHIGSWPVLFSVLWDVPEIKIGTKYNDSAVLLKWDTIAMDPGAKRIYTTIFGLYNKGTLELVPAGTNFTGTTKTGSRVKPGKPDFTVSPDTIYEGQTTLLKWNVDNPLMADIYVSAKAKTKQRNQGKMSISPKGTTIYYLQLIDHGKEIANVNVKVVVLKRPAEIIPEKINFDGKFTIGSNNKHITYGYPFPYSTSYFQLNYKKEYFSNNSVLDKSNYLEATQNLNMAKEKRNVLSYKSTDFEIIQRLIPLDEKFEITEAAMAVYFRCEYCVKNLKNAKSYFGFKQILDFSSLDADKLQLQVNEKPAKFNMTYTDTNIPDLILLSDKHDNKGIKLFTMAKGGEKPKSVSVGDWHFLKNLKLETSYSDSSFYKNPAALISWQKSILPYDSAKFVFIIGTNQNQKLQYLYNQSEEVKSMSINFETSQYKVPEDKINEIINFVKDSTFDFMVLEGFSDNRGKLETNYLLSKKRINNIMEIITHKTDIKDNQILNQVHGEFYSNQKSNNQEVNDMEERKVKIVLFRVLK